MRSLFLSYVRSITPGKPKLICIHHAGGGASAYISWQEKFGDSIDVLPVQLPGRENRISEPLIRDMDEAATKIADDIIPFIRGCRFAVFGHSMGGLIAFELACELEKRGLYPECCFISASAFDEYIESEKSKYLSDEDFIRRVELYEAVSEGSGIFEYPEIRDVYINILRADFDLVEDHVYDGKKVSCPVYAFCGDSDKEESIENMHSWESSTEKYVEYRSFSGNHFYLDSNLELITKLISESMKKNGK